MISGGGGDAIAIAIAMNKCHSWCFHGSRECEHRHGASVFGSLNNVTENHKLCYGSRFVSIVRRTRAINKQMDKQAKKVPSVMPFRNHRSQSPGRLGQ